MEVRMREGLDYAEDVFNDVPIDVTEEVNETDIEDDGSSEEEEERGDSTKKGEESSENETSDKEQE